MLCPSCGAQNPADARFCNQCGTRLAAYCEACGFANVPEARFCNQCGARLAAGATPEAAAPAQRTELTSIPALEEERRPVTMVFADIVGFTSLADRLDPEEVGELTAITLGRLAREITSFGGTIDKFIGDAVLALFGAPTAHEDDAERAVGAGLAMLRAIDELNETLALPAGARLAIRVGINTGQVVVGSREVGGHYEYTAIGDAVNVASRLEAAAQPGTVLVGETTFRGANRAYAFLPLPQLTLRGKPEPVSAYQALGPLTGDTRLEAVSDEVRAPLVGRDAELASLQYCLDQLLRGRGQIAFVVGEPGIGKTRLITDLHDGVAHQPIRWAIARGISYAQHVSYGIFAGTIQDLVSAEQAATGLSREAALDAYVSELGVPEAYPFLAHQIGLPVDPGVRAELQRLSPPEFQARLVDAIGRWLGALAQRSPVVFVVDDVHWADPSSVDLLDGLLPLVDRWPIFFCFLLRPERQSAAWQLKERAARDLPHRFTEVTLQPLDDEDRRALVARLVEVPPTLRRVEEQLVERTAGNPLFIEEVVRDLAERGVLLRTNGRWQAVRDVEAVHLPDSLQSAIIARVDRLSETVRVLVQTASVLGRVFGLPVLERILGDHPTLEADLRDAQRLELLSEVAISPERRFSFRHPLVQEAVYQTLLVRRRRELHEAAGHALETLYADRLTDVFADLARHYAAAERWELALRFARLEADRAAGVHAIREALSHYQLAWRAAEHVALSEAEAVELLEKLGDAQARLGLSDEAVESYREALDRAAGPNHLQRGRLLVKLARVTMGRQDPDATATYLDAAFSTLPADAPELSLAWRIRSWLDLWFSDYESAARSAEQALAVARQHDDFACLVEAYDALTQPALAALPGRDFSGLTDEWIAAARERGDQQALFRGLNAMVLNQLWIRGVAEPATSEAATEALELAERLESESSERIARALLGACLYLQGRWSEALVQLETARTGEAGLGPTDELIAYWLGLLLTHRGRLDEGRAVLAVALESLGFPHTRIWLTHALAVNRLLAGERDVARAALERATEMAEQLHCALCQAVSAGVEAELWPTLGHLDRAELAIVQARELGEYLRRGPTLLAAARAEAALSANRGDPARAVRQLRAALRLARRIGQPFEIGQTELRLGELLARSERASEQARGIAHIRAALDTLRALGANVAASTAHGVEAAGELASVSS